MDFWALFFVFTLIQAVLLSLVFLRKGLIEKSYFILAVMLIIIALILFDTLVRHINLYHKFPHAIGISFFLNYLICPLYYFYFRTQIEEKKWNKIFLLCALPLLVPIIRRGKFYLSSGHKKVAFFENAFVEGLYGINMWPVLFEVCLNISYLILCLRLINQNEDYSKKNSFFYLTVAFILFWLCYFIGTFLMSLQPTYSPTYAYIQHAGLASFVLILAYTLMYDSDALKVFRNSIVKYQKSKMAKDQLKLYAQKIICHLSADKPYLESTFNQKKLAESIGLSSNNLSQVLNDELKITFHDLINKYRIEEMKKRLTKDKLKYMTIAAIGYEVGFNSKSGITRNFKKFTGTTPSEFIKKETHPKG